NTVAYLVAVTDDFSLGAMQEWIISMLMQNIAPYMIVLLVLITAISVILSLRIRNATRTVIRIADGDLTARIDNKSGDELGEICRQVNTMASNLEVIFDEKDKNEQFYYKFVPEKFRELLGKEKITDLALGDAESEEFSVLFCDIRSFSINSEMLTAKENFEFVNVVFGIAGPIIREYNGFVDKYIGDAVMALFESPDDALQAGIKIYRSIVLDPSVAERLNMRDINIGVGIHTGIARIGIVGESERLSGTVISDTVNLSSRLESLTKMYHTAMIVSKDTIDRMKDPDVLNKRYIGMVQVAGVNDVTALYEILDCLSDEERERRTANKDDFKEAVRLFHLGRREEAVEVLKGIQASGKADHVVDMYCDYIANMSSEDKGNIFRFVRK
ncbi:MAG: adenylate/guanylate cyclase domain-containing protein, partial [Ruminiclostridium sp.]|nr:adenylate/guanylate cyclase domain-containing protein [Ruminiclostridium sp.]